MTGAICSGDTFGRVRPLESQGDMVKYRGILAKARKRAGRALDDGLNNVNMTFAKVLLPTIFLSHLVCPL